MSIKILDNENKVVIRRTLPTTPEAVFDALTTPEMLAQWFAPSEDYVVSADVTPMVGGEFRITMEHKEDPAKKHILTGGYKDFRRPIKLFFSWKWESADDPHASNVDVDIHNLGQETELIVTHESFFDRKSREEHAEGWQTMLDRLEEMFRT